MTARLPCPMCKAPAAVEPKGDGAVVACSVCGQQFRAVAPKPVDAQPIPKAAAPQPTSRPAPPPLPKKVEPVWYGPPKSTEPPPTRRPTPVEPEDEEDEDEVPVTAGPPTGLIIGAGAAVVVFLLMVVVAIAVFTSRKPATEPDTSPAIAVVPAPPKNEVKPPVPKPVERKPKTQAELAKLGRAASAYVEGQVGNKVGSGSAFCVQSDGLFVTNAHVVENVRGDVVRLVLHPTTAQQRDLGARVIKRDTVNDLALLHAAGTGFEALDLADSDALTELQTVVAFGFPFGRMLATEGYPAVTVSEVKISSFRRRNGALHMIQLNGALNPGNSGCAVLDETGAVIGVVARGIPGSGLADAIPSNVVKQFLTGR
jgi:S1-C subfamily serine protease